MQLWIKCNLFKLFTRLFDIIVNFYYLFPDFKRTCNKSLTLSMGATAVLEMAAATPPAKKSFKKLITASDMMSYLLNDNLTSSKNPSSDALSNGRVLVFAPNISGLIIARGADDGSTRDQTESRSWINIPGHRLISLT